MDLRQTWGWKPQVRAPGRGISVPSRGRLRSGWVAAWGKEGADDEIEQPTRRTKQEGQQQARHEGELWEVAGSGVACLPDTDEEIECQIVDPTGEEDPRIAEQCGDTRERIEIPLGVTDLQCDEDSVDDREEERHGLAGPLQDAGMARADDQREPSQESEGVEPGEEGGRRHAGFLLRDGMRGGSRRETCHA